jgi:hypothetical protein
MSTIAKQIGLLWAAGPGFSYDEYLIAVKSAATNIDEHCSTKSTRDINMLMNDPPNDDAAIIEYAINKVKRRYWDSGQLAAQMNRETWEITITWHTDHLGHSHSRR